MRQEELKILRIKNNLSQEEISKKLGVSKATYNLIENEKKNGNLAFWKNIQKLYGLSDAVTFILMKNEK